MAGIPLDTIRSRSYDPPMPLWRCPHCGTPQEESSRCWVCRRSTTSCGTCRHFRRGVASGLGLCGLDPRRLALRGSEIRECWVAPAFRAEAEPERAVARPVAAPGDPDAQRGRTFVPVGEVLPAREPAVAASAASTGAPANGAWSLWGDLDG